MRYLMEANHTDFRKKCKVWESIMAHLRAEPWPIDRSSSQVLVSHKPSEASNQAIQNRITLLTNIITRNQSKCLPTRLRTCRIASCSRSTLASMLIPKKMAELREALSTTAVRIISEVPAAEWIRRRSSRSRSLRRTFKGQQDRTAGLDLPNLTMQILTIKTSRELRTSRAEIVMGLWSPIKETNREASSTKHLPETILSTDQSTGSRHNFNQINLIPVGSVIWQPLQVARVPRWWSLSLTMEAKRHPQISSRELFLVPPVSWLKTHVEQPKPRKLSCMPKTMELVEAANLTESSNIKSGLAPQKVVTWTIQLRREKPRSLQTI